MQKPSRLICICRIHGNGGKAMNKSKIEWCDMTWNPVAGCLHGCEYCYARRIANRFGGASETHYNECVGEECQWCTEETGKTHDLTEPIYDVDRGHNAPYPFYFDPTFFRYRLDEPQKVKKSQKVFVCSMADLFGEWVPDEWQLEVYKACGKADWHKYLFLTKNPKAYSKVFYRSELDYRHNFWLGTTVTDDKNFNKRGFELFEFTGADQKRHANRFLSIEPLLGEISDKVLSNVQFIDWVIIGAETGNRKGKVIPEKEWIDNIVSGCHEAGVPVFMKNSLKDLMGDDFIQEWPEGLR